MKKLEFETSKGSFVLIDESELPKIDEIIVSNDNGFIRLSNITEEQASDIIGDMSFHNYGNYLPTFKSKIEAFIKSKGVHLFEYTCSNQYCENGNIDIGYGEFNICSVCEDKEDLTYSNPYLFKKI